MRTRAVVGRTMAESVTAFEPLPRPRAGAPHVVLIVLDDLGFAQLGCFGSDIETPAIDGVAASGGATLPPPARSVRSSATRST